MPHHTSATHGHPTTTAEAHVQPGLDAPFTSAFPQLRPLPSPPAEPTTHLAAANSFGPYLFEGLATNHPQTKFLIRLSDPTLLALSVPHYLHANHFYMPTPNGSPPIDPFRFYLCASLARHHSYRSAYLDKETSTAPPPTLYSQVYQPFQTHFTAALRSLLATKVQPSEQEQQALVSLERTLTHVSFALWPDLFDRSFWFNIFLYRRAYELAPTLLDVLARQPEPRAVFDQLRAELRNQWIDLDDAKDVLDRGDPRYKTWWVTEEAKRQSLRSLDRWDAMADVTMAAFDDDEDDRRWRQSVDHLRDIGAGGLVGEPVPVWDDLLDGRYGLTGWRRELARWDQEDVGAWMRGAAGTVGGNGGGRAGLGERGDAGNRVVGGRMRGPGRENQGPVGSG